MRIRHVSVRNFRGVVSTSLQDCGSLNVLIGKNNSGKSTILDAIDGFFKMCASGSAVQLRGPLSRSANFRREAIDPRIEVEVQLRLTPKELLAIHEDIVSEAPQMKNALEDIDESQDLAVTVAATNDLSPYVYAARISLVHPDGVNQGERLLLSIGSSAAAELHQKASDARKISESVRNLETISRRLEPGEFSRIKDGTFPREMMSSLLSRYVPRLESRDTIYQVERVLEDATDYADFRERIDSMVQVARREASDLEQSDLENGIETFSGEATRLPGYALAILRRIGDVTYLHLRDRREPVGRDEAQRLLSLKVRRGGTETLRNIQETVRSLMGVAIDAFESQPDDRRPRESSAEMDVDEVLVEMNGAGIREALRLVLDNELTSPELLLVEEPEIHLHPALEMSMLRYLKSISLHVQIFVTTHSTNFLDTSDIRNVYLTTRTPAVEARLLDHEEAEEAIPAQLGLRLSSLFMFDRLVFVEGKSDEAVLREFSSKLRLNLGRAGVGFILIGGARNFTHYASETTVAFLSKRRVKMTFVLDRDESSEDEIERLRQLLDSHGSLHVLERREMENYLIIPSALAQFINLKRAAAGNGGEEVGVEEVAIAIEAVAEELKDASFGRALLRPFCKPLYPSRERLLVNFGTQTVHEGLQAEADRIREELDVRIEAIKSAAETQEGVLEERWTRNKLAVVPGDELLDGVCMRMGVRFKKERDAQRLASLVDAKEIGEELTRLLTQIASES